MIPRLTCIESPTLSRGGGKGAAHVGGREGGGGGEEGGSGGGLHCPPLGAKGFREMVVHCKEKSQLNIRPK